MASMDAMLNKLGHQRGPGPGGGRSHEPRWWGIVERTPRLWVSWITRACRELGRPVTEALVIDGVRVSLVWVPLTYGRRYYFVAPCCGRRVEALYFLGRTFGCRRCLHLGYASQASRPTSVWRFLDQVYDRRPPWRQRLRRYEEDDNPVVAGAVEPLRQRLAEGIEAMLQRACVVAESPEQRADDMDDRGGHDGDRSAEGG